MARDEPWFEEFYERHRPSVAAYCARRVGAVDASEAVSDVFAVAWRRRDDVPADRELPWLYGVARRVVSHRWRTSQRARRLVERAGSMRPPPQSGPEVIVMASVEHRLVRDAVMQLRPMDREVLTLSAWEGLTHAQIADVIGCSSAAVDKRFTRAKARLARAYESLDGPDPTRPAREPVDEIQIPQRAPGMEVRERES